MERGGSLTEWLGEGVRSPANTWKHSGIYTGPKASICLAKGVGNSKVPGYPEQSGEVRES